MVQEAGLIVLCILGALALMSVKSAAAEQDMYLTMIQFQTERLSLYQNELGILNLSIKDSEVALENCLRHNENDCIIRNQHQLNILILQRQNVQIRIKEIEYEMSILKRKML